MFYDSNKNIDEYAILLKVGFYISTGIENDILPSPTVTWSSVVSDR